MKIRINNTPREITSATAKIVKGQPGYHRQKGDMLMLAKTSSGGVRLYSGESGNWMDASLADITDRHVVALVNNCK
jgi:hypothetical protein